MHNNFVSAEEISAEQNNIRTLVRFVSTLTLLRRLFIPTMLMILFSACTPPYFLWFLGQILSCAAQGACEIRHQILDWEILVPVTTSSMVMIALFGMFCRIVAWGLFELSGQWSTQEIQSQMMRSISHVRTTFFDENPSGRLINRLLGDYGMLRLEGVSAIGDTANGLAEVICVGLLIMIANPYAGLLIIPAVLLYVGLQMQLAPMMSHARELRAVKIGEALHRETDLIEGRTVFALFDTQSNLLNRIHKAFGESMNIQLFYCKLVGWGMLWMGGISAAYAVIVYGFLVYGLHSEAISATIAAVVITAVFNLNNLFFGLAWDMSYLGEVASHARRTFFMIDLPHESTEESRVHEAVVRRSDVAVHGDIVFRDYCMSYRRDLPLILDGLDLVIPEGKKVGMVGRTGAGKTSIMQSLFRMVYHQRGDITIGGRSVFSMDVNYLRSQFGVVPQNPYLFAGTIRGNLIGDYAGIGDGQLKHMLDVVGMDVDLDAEVLEGGRDYSVGERQLLCLARLILLDKQYVLMDEPTSSLDRKTDERIQLLLRTSLLDKTVITIAHRLESLEHYDLIVELSEGRLLRQGEPQDMIGWLDNRVEAVV